MIKEEQFIQLFVRHEAELRGFAMTLMPRIPDAEDVVQEACVAMWKRIGDLQSEESFRSWAYTFVRFTALNKIRKQQRSMLVFSESLVELLSDEGEKEAALAQAELEALVSCLKKLPAIQRDLVTRYYTSANTRMADIAEALQRNVGGLYKALERARDSLRTCIGESLKEMESEQAPGLKTR